ncbi:MAG: acyl-CoA thioesterase II [Marmoricola sp.]
MPGSVDELIDLLDLEPIEANLFRGQQPDTLLQRVFGGQVLAQAIMAAIRTVSDAYLVHSLHSYFLRPGDTSVPIVYDVDSLRDGRSFATRRVTARQHGRPIFFMTANFQIPEDGVEHADPMPQVMAPEECPDVIRAAPAAQLEEWRREWAAVDMRRAGSTVHAPGAAHVGRSQWWIKLDGELPDSAEIQTAAFTYATDMTLLPAVLVPHGLNLMSPGVQSASLDHTIWFHRPIRADQWWLYDQTTPSAQGARGLALARVFQDGKLCATVAQEGLVRVSR